MTDKTDYLELADGTLRNVSGSTPPDEASASALMGIGLALLSIAEELKRYNDRAENEIDRQEMLAEVAEVRNLYAP